MKRLVPTFLKYPLVLLYACGKCLMRGGSGKDVVLNLVGVLPLPGSRAIIHGGKVKLLALREKFGDSWKRFNIAYFVSSGLPSVPAAWIRAYKMFGVKVVWNQNGFAYPALYPLDVVARVNGLFTPMRLADFVVYQTEFTKRCTEKFLGRIRTPSAVLINPVDTEKFRPAEAPLPEDPFVILMAGNHFESEERMKISLGAVRLVREQGVNAKLLITGRPEHDIREEWIEQTGAFTQDEAPALYRKAHLLLHLKYLDPCPTNVLEALATGLPVVGQANGGMPELVGDSAGILLPAPEDFDHLHYPSAKEVAEAILKVRDNLPDFSREAREQALKFDKKLWLKKHEDIFNLLLKK
ncbi:glycosyltransferase family 4 protein [Candidatus Parcubacteria bacterium]|nr:glycosyltransferase family 4 protein [Candidatus Parcubacteria bacterium]